MISALLILIVTALLCLGLGFLPQYAPLSKVPALAGMGAGLLVSLLREGFPGAGVIEAAQSWPRALSWLGEIGYRTDPLSAGLGAWCILLGGLCLLRVNQGRTMSWQLASGVLTVATLYSLVHTWDLRAFAAQVLLLALLCWASNTSGDEVDEVADAGDASRHRVALGIGAITLLGVALLVGRTTGGTFSLADLSLSAFTEWPLALLALFTMLWLGMAPVTGWSGRGHGRDQRAIVQTLVLGVPVLVLILRLQALVTAQGLAGNVPQQWNAFTEALGWAGGLTALVAAAGMLARAGAPEWSGLLTAHVMALAL